MTERNPLLIDVETLEEDDEIYADSIVANNGTVEIREVVWTPSAEDEVIVDTLLRETRYYREEIAKLEAREKAEIARVKAVTASATSSFRFSLARRLRSLEAFSEATNGARRVSPCGVLKWKKGSERVRFLTKDGEIVDNDDRFNAGLNRDSRLVKTEVSVRKDEVAKVLRGKGYDQSLSVADVELVKSLAVMDRAPSTFVVETPK